jgi:hypothetical protein
LLGVGAVDDDDSIYDNVGRFFYAGFETNL